MLLPSPLDQFVVEYQAGQSKDFGLKPGSTYPLAGVTYPTQYGYIPGYLGEDGADLDLFVGSDATGFCGFILCYREEVAGEHKFYINVTAEEEQAIFDAFQPVLLESGRYKSLPELIMAIESYKQAQTNGR